MVRHARPRRLRQLAQTLRGERRVLYSAGSPMNVVVLRPLLDALERDPRVELFFTGDYRAQDDAAALAAECGLAGGPVLSEVEAKEFQGDLYLCPDGSRYGKLCASRVLLFHGVSFKGRSLVERARWFHRVFLAGPYQRRRFVAKGIFEADDPRLLDVGMPKLDRLARGDIDPAPVRAALGAAPGDTLVLYAPTWGEQSSLHTLGEELLATLAARPQTRVAVKFHDHHLNPRRSPVDWAARARGWRFPNVAVAAGHDVVPLLAAADVLITDVSSVAQEFCLLDRPILYADVPELIASERYRDTIDREALARRAGPLFRTPQEALAALERAIADPQEHSALRQSLARDLFYAPGEATARALAAIYRELRLAPPA